MWTIFNKIYANDRWVPKRGGRGVGKFLMVGVWEKYREMSFNDGNSISNLTFENENKGNNLSIL